MCKLEDGVGKMIDFLQRFRDSDQYVYFLKP